MMKVVFLDKDGTLVQNVPYNTDPKLLLWMPGVFSGLKRLHQAGFAFIIVSNQSGVARGFFEEEDLLPVWNKMCGSFQENGTPLLDVFYCPHHPDGVVKEKAIACDCRKPEPGLLLQAARKHQIDLRNSWMIGDILDDIAAGNQAGVRTVLLNSPNETEWEPGAERVPDYVADNFQDATDFILGQSIRHPVVRHENQMNEER